MASSSAWKRRFSSRRVWPDSRLPAISGAIGPTQSGEKATFSSSVEDVVEELAEAVDDGAKAHGVDGLALGAAEVRAEDDLGFAAERVLDGGDGFADAGVVGDGAVLGEGDVEVDADEDALVGEVEVADGELGHSISSRSKWTYMTVRAGRYVRPVKRMRIS